MHYVDWSLFLTVISVAPDVKTYNVLMNAFGKKGDLELQKKYLNEMKEMNLTPTGMRGSI